MHYLEIASDNHKIHTVPSFSCRTLLDFGIYVMELSMALQRYERLMQDAKDLGRMFQLTQPSKAIRTPRVESIADRMIES